MPEQPGRGILAWLLAQRSQAGFLAGPLLFLAMLGLGAPEGLPESAWRVLALTLWMAIWWVTESLPIAITALLPVALLPLMQVQSMEAAAAPYANPLIFLFLGGFLIAEGLQRWNLHRRLSLAILGVAGSRPDRLVGGFMAATAFLSMWVSNTATTALMLPIALSVLKLVDDGDSAHDHHNLDLCLLLGIAMGANIGGMATLIGTPPNALLAGYLQSQQGIGISFGRWMAVAFPLALLLLGLAWWLLTRRIYPVSHAPIPGLEALLADERRALGPLRGPESAVAAVFATVALAWLTRPLLNGLLPDIHLTDAGIALLGALLLFTIPVRRRPLRFLLDWSSAKGLPWGVLLLVGGGLSLGGAIGDSGLADAVARALHLLAGHALILVIAGLVLPVMLLSNITSNTATAATLLPIAASLALALEFPVIYLAAPVALAASCAFLLPVSTPPNAIVFSSERLTVAQMARAGALMSLGAMLVITVWVWLFAGRIL